MSSLQNEDQPAPASHAPGTQADSAAVAPQDSNQVPMYLAGLAENKAPVPTDHPQYSQAESSAKEGIVDEPDALSAHHVTPSQQAAEQQEKQEDSEKQDKGAEDDQHGQDQQQDGDQQPRSMTDELKDKLSHKKDKVKEKASKPPGGFDDTPLPDCPPGFTLKFTFHRAWNLPAADIHNAAADPYITAELDADIPRRHKEDPIMDHRTPTMRRTLEPKWEDSWIVANVPASGFRLKCRLYDEDQPDHDDRLGNVTYLVSHIDEHWKGPEKKDFEVKKRSGSKRAYLMKAASTALSKDGSMTPHLEMSVELLGRSDPPGAQMYTLGPTSFTKHYSPMIGRLTGIKVNADENHDKHHEPGAKDKKKEAQKYDFQANEVQFQGPVPPKLYHRFVEFRPIIGRLFSSHGLRGKILNKALHKQHNRVYNYDNTTEWGHFKARSEDATLQFLRLVHFDEGGRLFTYVLTLDGLMRFTETGAEFGIDLLSKHTMHSNAQLYIACSGEFFIRRLKQPTGQDDLEPDQPTHPDEPVEGGPPKETPPTNPAHYQLIIDNDSGTYRPDKSVLPELKKFLQANLPGLGVVAMHWEDEKLQKMKKRQSEIKKKEGKTVNMVLNRSPSSSSFSSDDESRLGDIEGDVGTRKPTKKEVAWEMLENPTHLKDKLASRSKKHSNAGQEA